MKSLDVKQQFIELRAKNESFATIAKKLNVSKPTLINRALDCIRATGNGPAQGRGAAPLVFESEPEEAYIEPVKFAKTWTV